MSFSSAVPVHSGFFSRLGEDVRGGRGHGSNDQVLEAEVWQMIRTTGLIFLVIV